MKKFKTTWLLAAIFFALIVSVYLFEIQGGKKRAALKEKEEKVLLFEKENIEEVILHVPRGHFRAKRMGEKEWALEEPLKARGDKWAWNQIVETVSDLKFKRVIEESAPDLSAYGLAEPKIRIELQLKGEKAKKALKVGDENPIGDSLFATTGETKRVVLVPSYLSSSLNKELKQLREKRLFTFDTTKARSVEAGNLSFKKEGEKWIVFSSSKKDEADLSKVTTLLNTLDSLEVKEFESESPSDLKKYGLNSPSLRIVVKDEKNKNLLELLFGKKDKDGVYVSKKGEKPVYRLSSYVLDEISLDVSKYIKKEEKKEKSENNKK